MSPPTPESIAIDGRLRRRGWELPIEGLRIGPGRTAVVGPNGAGKTSLLRLIAGLEAIDDGRVVLGGTRVDDPTASIWIPPSERPVAMVFQDHRLFSHLRAVDDVAFPLRRRGVRRHEARARAHELLERLGVADHADEHPHRLSGGQRQRVAVARALARDASILLLDEPLASIDDASRQTLRDLFTADAAPTVVWVTHDPADAADADAVIALDGDGVGQTVSP